jgi:glycosyltransferase involved in cell wall biosynthesis
MSMAKSHHNWQGVTFICQAYPPQTNSTAQLLEPLLGQLAAAGLSLRLLTQAAHGHPHLERHSELEIRRLGMAGPGGLARLAFALHALFFALRDPGRLVVANTNPPFLLWVLALIARFRQVPVRLWAFDLYPEVLEETKVLKKGGWSARIWKAINRLCYPMMDQVMALAPDMVRHLERWGIPPERLRHCSLWGPVPTKDASQQVATQAAPAGKLRLLYAGNLGLLSDLEPIINVAATLPELELRLVGDGMRAHHYRALLASRPSANIHLLPFVPLAALPETLAWCQIGFVSLRAGLSGLALPCKVYGLLAAGRAILAEVPLDSAVAQLVLGYQCGWVVAPGDEQALTTVLLRLLNEPQLIPAAAEKAAAAAVHHSLERALPELVNFFGGTP